MNTINRFRVLMEIPVKEKFVKSGGILSCLCRMVISSLSDKHGLELLSDLIKAFCPEDRSIFIKSISEFVTANVLVSKFGENIHFSKDLNYFKIANKEVMADVLSMWEAENLAILLTDEICAEKVFKNAENEEPKWWQFASNGYESTLLGQIDLVDPFLFFSKNHMSIEIIGTQGTVLEYLETIKSFEKIN